MPDLVVVGGGPGGVAAAITGARMGASVTLIESGNLGGTCVHSGCIPSGAFHRAMDLHAELAGAGDVGLRVGAPEIDWERLSGWASSVVSTVASRTRSTLEYLGVEVLTAPARFVGPGRIASGNGTFEGVPMIIATGARSYLPELPGQPGGPILDNDGAMALSEPPRSLLVLGSGRFSIEWADLFARAGSRVTVVAPDGRILAGEDAELAGFLQMVLEERGVRFLLGTRVEDASGGAVVVAGEELAADAVLTADTRRPNVEGLNLSAAGIELTDHGGIAVDASCRTSAEGVFAAGDVTGPPWLSNRAAAQGTVAATNALGGSARVRPERIPRSVNTRPELAAVGLTHEEAITKGIRASEMVSELAANPRAITLRDVRGALKLVVDEEFGEILGAHMVGVGGVEVIAQVVAAMEVEADYRDLARAHHIHPSLAELVTQAAGSGP